MKKLALLLVIIAIGLQSIMAQTKEISGTVTSANDGSIIPGVSVLVKGTSLGTITDFDGKFALKVPQSAQILVFSFVGLTTQEVVIGDRSFFSIAMESEDIAVDEVLIVAYGTANKKAFAGSATAVDAGTIERKAPTEITKALAGEVAGVQVINTSGQPGTTGTIRIRGFGSVNSSRAPLYVVDGIPYDGDLSSIDPSDIESTTILKDATATALYGSRGANGVIVITTKRGKSSGEGKIEVDLRTGVNIRMIPLYDVLTSPEQFTELTWEGLKNKYSLLANADPAAAASSALFSTNGIDPMYNMWNADGANLIDATTGKFKSSVGRKYTPEKWEDYIFRTGQKHEATLKISGGSEKTTYYNSFGYLKDEGYYLESDFDRINVRSNISHEVKKWLKGTLNMAYAYSEQNSPGQTDSQNNGFQFVNYMPPIFPVFRRDENGNKIEDDRIGGYLYDYGMTEGKGRPYGAGINPAGAVQLDKDKTIAHNFTGSSMFELKITDDLKLTTNIGAQYYGSNNSTLTNPYYGDAEGLGRIYKEHFNLLSITANQILTYAKTFNEAHNFDAFIAHENGSLKISRMYGQKSNVARPDNLEWSNAVIYGYMESVTYGYSLESFFGQARYNYNDKYFLHATFRRDGSSRFEPENRWGNFGSLGAAWMLSEESFMSGYNWLDLLKIKASYGVIGNQAFTIGTGIEDIQAGYYPTKDLYSIANLNDEISFSFAYKGNPDLTWERSGIFNTGFEFTVMNRLEGEFEYFYKKTDNMLFFKQVSPSLGYARIPVNDGVLVNTGVELSLDYKAIDTQNVKLNINFNTSHYRNEMTKMPIDATTGKEKPIEVTTYYGYSTGHSIFDYYLREYAGVDKANGAPLYYIYYDEKSSTERVAISNMVQYTSENKITKLVKETTSDYPNATLNYIKKSAIPDLSGGFGFDLSVYGFDLNASFAYGIGGYGYDVVYATLMGNETSGARNWHKDILGRWQKSGDETDIPRLDANQYKYTNSASSRFLTKKSYLNMTNIRLAYNVPSRLTSKLKISNLSFWVAGDNLFLLTNRNGFVPFGSESGESGRSQYIPLSTIIGGVKFQF